MMSTVLLLLSIIYFARKNFHRNKNIEKREVKYLLLYMPFEQKLNVETYIKVEEYISKYYKKYLLLDFIQSYERLKGQDITIDTVLEFIDNPENVYRKYIDATG